jgi:HK97 family phage prohead protease
MPVFNHVKLYQFKAEDLGERIVAGYASTPDIDASGERILPTAFEESLPRYMRNPIVTWAHDIREIPIGKTVTAEVRPQGLWVQIQFGSSPRCLEVYEAVRDGRVRSLSVGFYGQQTEDWGRWAEIDGKSVWEWHRVDLWEIAVVPLPANFAAQITVAKALGLDDMRTCAATPYADLPTAPEDTPWEWNADVANEVLGDPPDWERYRKAHFWYQPERAQVRDGYKLPFARMLDGRLQAVWRGVAAAMAALLGARGGVDIPEADRRPVYNHIVRYYRKFGKQPPEFKGMWPAGVREVTFHAGELDVLEETIAYEEANHLAGTTIGLRNIVRHWCRTGRSIPARVADGAVRSIAAASEVVAACELSDEQRESLRQAMAQMEAALAPRAAMAQARQYDPELLLARLVR